MLDPTYNLFLVGGNSAKASSGMSACGTAAQAKAGIQDSTSLFREDTLNAGDHENDESLVKVGILNGMKLIETN